MISRIKLLLGGIGILVTALAASWFGGRKSAKTAAKQKELADYAETRKRMDTVDVADDPAVLREWLRERGKPGGGL
jgi:hypothetical protein